MNKNKIILYIDTSNNKKITVGLTKGREKFEMIREIETWASQIILPMIEEILKKYGVDLSELTEIKVNTGPGSFTGVRVGMAVANTLGWLLDIPVNGKAGIVIDAVYK